MQQELGKVLRNPIKGVAINGMLYLQLPLGVPPIAAQSGKGIQVPVCPPVELHDEKLG